MSRNELEKAAAGAELTLARLNWAILMESHERVQRSKKLFHRQKRLASETLGRAMVYLFLTGRMEHYPLRPSGMTMDEWKEILWEELRDPERVRMPQMKENPQ